MVYPERCYLSLAPCSQLDFISEVNSCAFSLDDIVLDIFYKHNIEKNVDTVFTLTSFTDIP